MTAAVAAGAIDLYQRFVSPYKGFRCAHRAVHGRRSCSAFAKRLVAKVGLLRFGPLFMRRLRKCGETARALKAGFVARRGLKPAIRSEDEEDRRKRQGSTSDGYCADCGSCGTPDLSGLGSCDVPDLSGAASGCDVPNVADGCDCGCDLSL